MIILKNLKLLKYLAILTITLNQIQSSLAEESELNLMRIIYEHAKKDNSDYSNDPEGERIKNAVIKSYEEMQRSKRS